MTWHSLHTHTAFSKDATQFPSDYIDRAIELGMSGIAISDHGTMSGIVNAYSYTKLIEKEDFKVIPACEIYIYISNERFHLTLLGDGNKGYNNLVRILNAGNSRQIELASNKKELEYNRVVVDDLIKYNENVYIATGCPASPFQKDGINGAIALVNKLKPYYDNRLFAEGMLSSDEGDSNLNHIKRAIELSINTNIPLIITNDVHRVLKTQVHSHQKYVQMNFPMFKVDKTGKPFDKSVVYKDLYLMNDSELVSLCYNNDNTCKFDDEDMKRINSGIDFTESIVNKLSGVKFSGKASLPNIPNADEKFKKIVLDALETYKKKKPHFTEAENRAKYELDIIVSRGFSTYFLLTQEFVNVGKKFGVVGKGRGSSAGSLVAYLMGITNVDPLEYNLLFERFLNPKRKSYPDIDIDMSESARNHVINYASEKYDAMPIMTYATYSSASLINDLKKWYKFQIKDEEVEVIKEFGANCKEFNDVCDRIPEFRNIWHDLLGQIKNTASHAGGIVIIPDDSETLVPTIISKDGKLLAGYAEGINSQDLEVAGGVKFDTLGLRTLTILDELKKITEKEPPQLSPKDYDKCMDLLNDEEADISGVFQLSGYSAREILKRMKIKNIEDIAIATSIARTGAKDSGTQDEYISRIPKEGYPTVYACPKNEESSYIMNIELDSGIVVSYPENFSIKLVDGSFIKISELDTTKHEIFIN